MPAEAVAFTLAAFGISCGLTWVMCRLAPASGLMDVPNVRSSHQRSTPRGGGVAVVATASGAFALLTALHVLDFGAFAALAGGLTVAVVGLIDDRRTLPAVTRLAVHFLAAAWAVAWLGGVRALNINGDAVALGAAGIVLAALAIVWAVNLFNFMDGIDGIAGSEAVFVSWAGAVLTPIAAAAGVAYAALSFGAACLGFLLWNWPPARIFMGDVGSGYTGYILAVLALAAARESAIAPFVWLTLGGVFFADATVTLVRRFVRRERLHEAHRNHAYQWLSRRWGSHRRVTLAVTLVNLIWLLPCAWLETRFPNFAAAIAACALAVVGAAALLCGAGRSETEDELLSSGN
jgi:Fuc2NAc and GlcNAc transferase